MMSNLGKKIKDLRLKKEMTLKDLSDKTGLSTGFISQLERGLSTISVDSLSDLAGVLDVSLSYFFTMTTNSDSAVLKSYEKNILGLEESGYVQYQASSDLTDKVMFPRVIELFPHKELEEISIHSHSGEEFLYVLEGVLTLNIDGTVSNLYPGDTAHFKSEKNHNWFNNTSKIVKILTVSYSNNLKEV